MHRSNQLIRSLGRADIVANDLSGVPRRRLRCGLSKCRNVGLAGANAHGLVDVEHKYLPVPDLPSLRGRSDGLDGVVDQLARHRYLDLDLRQQGHCVFGPPIELAMAPLAPISLDLGHCHSRDADRIESIADVLELEVLVTRVVAPVRRRHSRLEGISGLSRDFTRQRAAALARAQDAVRSPRFRVLTLEIAAWLVSGQWTRPQDDLVRDRGDVTIETSAAEQLT